MSTYPIGMGVGATGSSAWPFSATRLCAASPHGRPCGTAAVVMLPEIASCRAHLPAEWVPVLERRRRLWREWAPLVWADVLAETPVPLTLWAAS